MGTNPRFDGRKPWVCWQGLFERIYIPYYIYYRMMKTWIVYVCIGWFCVAGLSAQTSWKRDIVVASDGTGDYRTLTEAMEGIRAFMDYRVTVHVKNGVYREKWVVPSWLENVEIVGEDISGGSAENM